MDSWSYGGRNVFLANETVLPSDSLAQNRKSMPGFDYRHFNELENDPMLMSEVADFNGFSAISTTKVTSSCVVPSSLLPLEDENQSLSPNLSNVETQDWSNIDFKLRSFLDYQDNETSSRAFTLPAKKPRGSNPCSQKPVCQVFGCNMDLSFSKDYHKRHRVCEAHSKTSVVIVSGVEQRFCQQCSRFHFLSEFDDGKRSCRRRLAGHNERRRKPSFYFLPSRRHKLLHTSQESFPSNLLYRVIDQHDHCASRLVSFKDEPACSMFPAIGQNSSRFYSPEASGVSSNWNIHEVVPSRSTCALSLLSAQSQQQHLSQTPNTAFSITQPNQNLNQHMEQPLWIDPGKTNVGSSTVDLVQLSSHLQRIEEQRNFSDEVKQEYNELYFHGS